MGRYLIETRKHKLSNYIYCIILIIYLSINVGNLIHF